MHLERGLVQHCAPTLASLKTGSLFTLFPQSHQALEQQIRAWNSQLEPKGVRVTLLRQGKRGALIYVYRPRQLQRDMERPCVQAFLGRYGYEETGEAYVIDRLRQRLGRVGSFPMRLVCFWGIRWKTWRDLSPTTAKTANARAAGRSTATRRRRCVGLDSLKNVPMCTGGCGIRVGQWKN